MKPITYERYCKALVKEQRAYYRAIITKKWHAYEVIASRFERLSMRYFDDMRERSLN